MKKKILYGFLIVLFLGGLYWGLRLAFGLFTPYNFWTAEQDIKNGTIQLVNIGEQVPNADQKQKLAATYSLTFDELGCIVTTKLINGTEYYNKAVIEHLEGKYGTGWWTKFQSQLDSIDSRSDSTNKE